MRVSENGKRVVSVSIPIQHVRAVLGVLTLEAGDVDEIIAAERAALIPFALVAMGVTLLSSLMLTQLIAQPITMNGLRTRSRSEMTSRRKGWVIASLVARRWAPRSGLSFRMRASDSEIRDDTALRARSAAPN